ENSANTHQSIGLGDVRRFIPSLQSMAAQIKGLCRTVIECATGRWKFFESVGTGLYPCSTGPLTIGVKRRQSALFRVMIFRHPSTNELLGQHAVITWVQFGSDYLRT